MRFPVPAALSAIAFSLLLVLASFAATGDMEGVRASILDFQDDPWKFPGHEEKAARFFSDGLLVFGNGKVKDIGPYSEISAKYPGLHITSYKNRIIMPGFIDGHIHVGQTRVLGAPGEQMKDWAQKWIYPEEIKFKDSAYAREAINHYFDNLLSAGTTTVQDCGTGFESAAEIYFDEASKRNMRVITGLSGMDRLCPNELVTSPELYDAASRRLIGKYHRHGRNLYSFLPRSSHTASPALMSTIGKLHKEFPDCWVNTHMSENPADTLAVVKLNDCSDYLSSYEKYDLVGPKFTAGHAVWASDSEFDRLSKAGASIAFCPTSNLFLGNGLFRIGKATDPDHRVRLIFGTDVGGGNSFSLISALNSAYKIGMCNHTTLNARADSSGKTSAEAERNKMNTMRSFYSLTLGGAQGLYLDDLIGNFNPGKEADFVVLDWNAGPPVMKWRQSLTTEVGPKNIDEASDLLFGVMAVGDERTVDETWVAGKRLYKRGELKNSEK